QRPALVRARDVAHADPGAAVPDVAARAVHERVLHREVRARPSETIVEELALSHGERATEAGVQVELNEPAEVHPRRRVRRRVARERALDRPFAPGAEALRLVVALEEAPRHLHGRGRLGADLEDGLDAAPAALRARRGVADDARLDRRAAAAQHHAG